MEISKEKIRELRPVIYGIIDKIKAWDKDGTDFAYALNNQFTILNTCGHEGADQALHAKEIEALTYAVIALNVLENEHLPKVDNDRNDRSNKGKHRILNKRR